MKKMIYSLALMLSCQIGYNQCSPVDSLLLLKLDGSNSEADSSVYNHPMLSIGGTTYTSDRNGSAGSSFLFDGDDDHLVVADSNTNYKCGFPITISCWINADTINLTNPIFTNEDYTGAYTGVWLQLTSDGYLALSYGDGTGNSGGSRVSAIGTSLVPTHQWVHIVATVTGPGNFALYINGAPETFNVNGSGGNMVYINNDSLPARVATFFKGNSTPRFFDGAIDDLRFWNAEIYPEQVQILYSNTPVYVNTFKFDTVTICNNEIDTLLSNASYCTHLWSTGDTTSFVEVDGAALGEGTYTYLLHYTEQYGYTYFDSIILRVENCVNGVSELNDLPLNVSPNPFTESIRLDFPNTSGSENSVEVYNALGEPIKCEKIPAFPYTLPMDNLATGIYFLQLNSSAKITRTKLIKQ